MSAQYVEFSSFTRFTYQLEGHVALLTLNRPEAHNSMDPVFWQELPVLLRQIDEQAQARVLIICAEGKHFSAGMDLAVFQGMAADFVGEPARRGERMRRLVLALQECFNAIERMRIPVIAAVHGAVIGGAVDLLCACDMRYACAEAFFSIKETAIGMTADLGTLQRIQRVMNSGWARELAYTGRHFSAQEAQQAGFVNQVYADKASMLTAVSEIAQSIAVHSPMAVHGTKHMLNYSRDHSLADSLDYMATWQAGMFQMTDVHIAMQAQKAQQIPVFEPLHAGAAMLAKKA